MPSFGGRPLNSRWRLCGSPDHQLHGGCHSSLPAQRADGGVCGVVVVVVFFAAAAVVVVPSIFGVVVGDAARRRSWSLGSVS